MRQWRGCVVSPITPITKEGVSDFSFQNLQPSNPVRFIADTSSLHKPSEETIKNEINSFQMCAFSGVVDSNLFENELYVQVFRSATH